MVSYNGQQRTHYDPVASQYHQQHHQNYAYTQQPQQQQQQQQQQQRATQSSQPHPPTSSGNQASYSSAYSQAPYLGYASTESRAAETLSHLSAQEHTSNRSSTSQFDTAGRGDNSSWNDSDHRSSNTQHDQSSWTHPDHASVNARRTANNPSPLYQNQPQILRPPSTASSNYSPVQSYAQPQQSSATSYSYMTYPRQDQSRAQQDSNQTNTYDYSTSQFRPSSPYTSRQQQQQHAPRSSISSATSTTPRDHQHPPSANVGQPRAPSVTPSSIQQNSSYSRHSNPPDHSHNPTTVDPSQVYDPWPEQQRKLAEARRKAEIDERRMAEEVAKKKAEEEAKRKAEEDARRKIEEEARQKAQEEARRRAEIEAKRKAAEEAKNRAEEEIKQKAQEEKDRQRAEEEAKRAETLRVAKKIVNQAEARRKRVEQLQQMGSQRQKSQQRQPPPPTPSKTVQLAPAMTTVMDTNRAAAANAFANSAPGENLESEMITIFKKMREMNQMDPLMFARMWEQERQAHLNGTQAAQPPAPQQRPQPQGPVSIPTPAHPNPVHAPFPGQSKPFTQSPVSLSSAATAGPSHVPTTGPQQPSSRPATSVTPSQNPNPNAIWPPGKKANLAESAARWLNERKENANKLVSTETIVALLAPNPSYMTLCENLEKMGLSLDRAQFARALLSIVPGADKAKPASPALPATQLPPSPAPAQPASQLASSSANSNKSRSHNIGKFGSQRGRPRKDQVAAVQNGGNVIDLTGSASMPVSAPSATYGTSMSQSYIATPAQNDASTVAYQAGFDWVPPQDDVSDYSTPGPSYQAQPPRPPVVEGLQNQQPRKYSSPYFHQGQTPNSTIAKPTPPPPAPRPPPANKVEAARKRTFAELVDFSAANSDSDEDMPPAKQVNTQQYDMPMLAPGYGQPPGSNLQQYVYGGQYFNPQNLQIAAPVAQMAPDPTPQVMNLAGQLRGQVLVQPIRREKVARKSRYDPRTICRDVLLATGRHPDMQPLNTHLNDIHQFLKSHSHNVDGDKFDLASIRWDLIDPGEPIKETQEQDRESTVDEEQAATDADDEGDNEGEEDVHLTSDVAPTTAAVSERAPSSHNTPAPVVSVQIPINRPFNSSTGRQVKPFSGTKRKLGRPPKNLPTFTSSQLGRSSAKAVNQQRAASSANALETPNSSYSKQQTPARANMSTTPGEGTTGYAAFREQNQQYDAEGNPIKRKGRPVGWRKSVHGKAALAAAAGASGDSTHQPTSSSAKRRAVATPAYDQVKRRNRQPKAMPAASKEPEVQFNVYKCQWEDCGSELHNIETLRKHVIKIHGKPTLEGDYECAWLGCFHEDEVTSFDDMGQWMEHMENMHVKPVARKLGDGPRAGLSDRFDSEASDAYLSDANGRLVTPRISAGPSPEGSAEWAEQRRRNEAANRLTNLQGQKLEDEKLLQTMEEKRRTIGPAMDKAGFSIATEERRENFLDDEDFFEVIDSDHSSDWGQE